MNTPEFYNPNEKPHDIDPSMPAFRFSGEEKKELLEKGVTEEETRQKEVEATNKLARKVIEEEQERAA